MATPIDIVLPMDFREKVGAPELALRFDPVVREGKLRALLGTLAPSDEPGRSIVPLIVQLGPFLHGRIESLPKNLGQVDDQLVARGQSLLESLRETVRTKAGSRVDDDQSQGCLLILCLLVQREAKKAPEVAEFRGFWVPNTNLMRFGLALGVLEQSLLVVPGGTPYARPTATAEHATNKWRDLPVVLCDIKSRLHPEDARATSGVPDSGASDSRVLAGLGALPSLPT